MFLFLIDWVVSKDKFKKSRKVCLVVGLLLFKVFPAIDGWGVCSRGRKIINFSKMFYVSWGIKRHSFVFFSFLFVSVNFNKGIFIFFIFSYISFGPTLLVKFDLLSVKSSQRSSRFLFLKLSVLLFVATDRCSQTEKEREEE